jgi:hypothetical protein
MSVGSTDDSVGDTVGMAEGMSVLHWHLPQPLSQCALSFREGRDQAGQRSLPTSKEPDLWNLSHEPPGKISAGRGAVFAESDPVPSAFPWCVCSFNSSFWFLGTGGKEWVEAKQTYSGSGFYEGEEEWRQPSLLDDESLVEDSLDLSAISLWSRITRTVLMHVSQWQIDCHSVYLLCGAQICPALESSVWGQHAPFHPNLQIDFRVTSFHKKHCLPSKSAHNGTFSTTLRVPVTF